MTAKTKDFQLSEETNFKHTIIHFYNIDAYNSSFYIYLEIDGKKIKSNLPKNKIYELSLKDLKKNFKKEFNLHILEDIELKIQIKIITKYTRYFKKKSKSFYKKPEDKKIKERKNVSPDLKSFENGTSIKDRVKLFSGEIIKKQITHANKPGKLIMPKIFQIENDTKNTIKENENKNEDKTSEKEKKTKKNINEIKINNENES